MTLEGMRGIVELAFRKYAQHRNEINKGFVKMEHIELVTDALGLKLLSNKELGDMWEVSYKFFDGLYCVYNENVEIIGYRPYNKDIAFYMDIQSAWAEIINLEVRQRKADGTWKDVQYE